MLASHKEASMIQSASVPGFLPSKNGFRFTNDFPEKAYLTIRALGHSIGFGNASSGLCGGMSFACRDYWEKGKEPPLDETPPDPGTPFFNYILMRLWDSFCLPWGPARYYQWQALSDQAILQRTILEGLPPILAEIRGGKPAALGFNRARSFNPLDLGSNHQVLAHAYETDEQNVTRLHLYDSNHGRLDTCVLTITPGESGGISYSTGETVRGFFHTPYSAPGPRWYASLFRLNGWKV